MRGLPHGHTSPMWRVEQVIQHTVDILSRLLDPVVGAIEWFDRWTVRQLEGAGIRVEWADRVVAVTWFLSVLLALRMLQGWWRVLALLVIVLVLGRLYGLVPRSSL